MNGFNVEPRDGVTVALSPEEDGRGASVSSSGPVDMHVTSPIFSKVEFKGLQLAFSPPESGEMILAESALAQPYMSITGLTPLSVKQPIRSVLDNPHAVSTFGVSGERLVGAQFRKQDERPTPRARSNRRMRESPRHQHHSGIPRPASSALGIRQEVRLVGRPDRPERNPRNVRQDEETAAKDSRTVNAPPQWR